MSDNHVTHEGVTYHLVENLPPLKHHVVTCPHCGGSGQMYSRSCRECKGRGLLFPPLSPAELQVAGTRAISLKLGHSG